MLMVSGWFYTGFYVYGERQNTAEKVNMEGAGMREGWLMIWMINGVYSLWGTSLAVQSDNGLITMFTHIWPRNTHNHTQTHTHAHAHLNSYTGSNKFIEYTLRKQWGLELWFLCILECLLCKHRATSLMDMLLGDWHNFPESPGILSGAAELDVSLSPCGKLHNGHLSLGDSVS